MKTKTCTKCGEEKALTEFHRRRRNKDGRRSDCKTCAKLYMQANKLRIQKNHAKWYLFNKEEIRERRKEQRKAWCPKQKRQEHQRVTKWQKQNRERYLCIHNRSSWKQRNNLSNSYTKEVICQDSLLHPSDIPNERVEEKRREIMFYRFKKRVGMFNEGKIMMRIFGCGKEAIRPIPPTLIDGISRGF